MIETPAHEERLKDLQSKSRKKIQRNEENNTVLFFNLLFNTLYCCNVTLSLIS